MAALFCVLLAIGGAHNAAQLTARSAGPLPSCAQRPADLGAAGRAVVYGYEHGLVAPGNDRG